MRCRVGPERHRRDDEVCDPNAGDKDEAGAPAEPGDRSGERRRCHGTSDIAGYLRNPRHDSEALVRKALCHQLQHGGEHQRVAAGDDQSCCKDVEQIGRQGEGGAPERRRRHADQHDPLDAVPVDQEAGRNLHQGVAPEIARGQHRDACGVGAEIGHETQADRLR